MLKNIKSALVQDWFYTNGGAEKCVQSFININPDFDVYALIDFLSTEDRHEIINGKDVNTSFIQKIPTAKSNHRKFLPLYPLAIEQFDLSTYDLILSSSSSVAKGVLTHSNQLHICYCHSPMRYAWDLYHQYLREANLTSGLKGWFAKYILHQMRIWDVAASNRVDHFIANSNYIAKRIAKVYNRQADVIYPPVNTQAFELNEQKEDFYLIASRMVPYKKIDVVVEAFALMPDKRLVVIGDGPDFNKIKAKATKNIDLLGYQPFSVLKEYMQKAKAFVFAAEEDFGIVPVEAQACGTPVIAYGKGGSKETIVSGKTGIFFYSQLPVPIKEAVLKFEKDSDSFIPSEIRKHAIKFSTQRFEDEITLFIKQKIELL
ncbi:glycosyltransferase family 4 protein [Pontibacter silvestris]|uniref:Glycosyltransferase family 4 protein n=1 Tax=Pontibacter silvestris TaxID=2305183 RepID=A0ABW4WSI4_9BACT|nr:glycosyltransferase family 4 protein [Pontibacter silvestris]MCC9137784.1 glycosyltransferase family 4 protein [Pontibacter silvestris]